MSFCKKCGCELREGDEFCRNCGTKAGSIGIEKKDVSDENNKKGFFGLYCPFCNEKIKFAKNVSKNFCPSCGKEIDYSELLKESKERKKPLVVASNAKKAVINAIDENGNGEIDIEDIIIKGMKTPGIRVKREDYFRRTFSKEFPEEVVTDAILNNPSHAGISIEIINNKADAAIKFERYFVSGISTALGAPGGIAMAATVPADIIQYYAYMLRAAQKLLYLYGFPEIEAETEGGNLDDSTMNTLILCMGVMYGVAGANNAIKAVAKALASGVEKQLLKKALTKGTIYPIVKSVAKWFGVKMTKEVFASFFKHSIPVMGGIIGGGMTFITFKPCCNKLKNALKDTKLADKEKDDDNIIDITSDDIIEVTENEYVSVADITGASDNNPEEMFDDNTDIEELIEDDVLDDLVCPRCNAKLVFQEGFENVDKNWKCKACGQEIILNDLD